jgi:site-specific recombinase XerD
MDRTLVALGDTVESFLLSCRVKGCTSLTLRTYGEALHRFAARVGEDLASLTALEVQKHFAALQAEGLKQVTVHKHYRAIRRFLAWSVEAQILSANPLAGFHMKRPQSFPHVPLDEDVQRVLKHCGSTQEGRRARALVLFIADTGLRVSELTRLHVEDVNLGLRSCTVRAGKGQKPRTVFFGPTTAKALRDYLATRQEWHPEDFCFAHPDGRPLSRFQVGHILASLSRKAGLARPISPHGLRHYFATAFLRAGGDLETLRQLLGHTTLTMTLRYCHMLQLDVSRNYRRASPVDHLLGG